MGGSCGLFNRFFEFEHIDEIKITIIKHLILNDNDFSNTIDEHLKNINTKPDGIELGI